MNKIILFDINNKHGEYLYNSIFQETNSIFWEKLESFTDFKIKLYNYINETNKILCLPFAWSEPNEEVKNMLEVISLNNIIISSVDENFIYPWSYDCVFAASEIGELSPAENEKISGTSIDAAQLALIALGGKDKLITYLNDRKKEF